MIRNILLFIVALSVLNQSINICYCEFGNDDYTAARYDDIDSFTELITEGLTDDDGFFPEQDEHQEPSGKTGSHKSTHFSPISMQERHSIFIVAFKPEGFTAIPQPATSEGFVQRFDAPPDFLSA